MITRITGVLSRVLDEEVRLQAGPMEYQVLVPELVRRAVQMKVGEEISFHTLEFLEGTQQANKLTPRLVGFVNEPEIEFFNLFCTVDGIGVRKALKAMVRPVREVAAMIQNQDAQGLATLPGISASLAERTVAKLRKKVARFALMVGGTDAASTMDRPDDDAVLDAYQALVAVGHTEDDARSLVDRVVASSRRKFKSVEEILMAVYQSET